MLSHLSDFWPVYVVLAVVVLLVGGVVVAVYHDEKQWEAFKAEHHCKVVAHISGDVFTTVGSGPNGVVVGVGSTPGKTGWLCDDGITYYR